jgi:CheY-like chemotaxis protein
VLISISGKRHPERKACLFRDDVTQIVPPGSPITTSRCDATLIAAANGSNATTIFACAGSSPVEKSAIRERKQYPALNAYSLGGKRMGLVESKRPVVLVVEDEFLLRMDAVDMIQAAGFEVVEAANADEAIETLEARRDISVVFTDIQMPGSMDGLKLARAVRGRWPPIKIVATSGHVGVAEIDLPEGGRFLAKPYSAVQVMGVLRELTGGG